MANNAPDADQPTATEATAEPKSKGGIPKIAIIAGVLLVQIVAAYFLQKTFLFNHVPGGKVVEAAPKKAAKKAEGGEGKVVMLDEIVVNPAETGGRRYLAVTLGLQLAGGGEESEKLVEKNKPLIRDALISLLSSKHLDQLASIAYRDTLKLEIKEAVSKQLKDTEIENVVFSGYVLQ
jgi:flagellar FliL protein